MVIKEDGSLVCSGDNSYVLLGLGNNERSVNIFCEINL